MPITVFEAISGNIRSFLGGAEIDLVRLEGEERDGAGRDGIRQVVHVEETGYLFTAQRPELPFTRTEEVFCRELLTAFAAMFAGFQKEDYSAHFRTALLASMMDITVARFLRGDNRKGFWPIQQLIQLLKNLSYQRYEGTPATTGFIVHRTTQPELQELIGERGHNLVALKPHQPISDDFFDNPLNFRFVDGNTLFFVANILMQVSGVLMAGDFEKQNDVERLTHRGVYSLVRSAGTGAFAIIVNAVSEIEVLINPDKLMVRRKGSWAIFDPDIIRSFLAGGLESEYIDDILWTVYALSKLRHGTVVLIYDGTPEQLHELKKGSVGGNDPIGMLLISQVKGKSVGSLKKAGVLLRILSSDGMAVFSSEGNLLETGFIIDTSHAREVVIGGGRTTAASAASFFGKVIKVSQDGPIELYRDGKLIYRFG
ncbi:hypothetical protein LPW11_04620 [Geomonas sp. RF6]|uniref:hypothetical protein n=1 Tax=Geomonas sp. RF6 TaxID=2897342 RepID=UPI001E3336D7|nr:hypothetical protein [Geomonas sp. RF6]UFS71484.1 hypothetical protein LPW11_04620 [Geomonas sp. RF6]